MCTASRIPRHLLRGLTAAGVDVRGAGHVELEAGDQLHVRGAGDRQGRVRGADFYVVVDLCVARRLVEAGSFHGTVVVTVDVEAAVAATPEAFASAIRTGITSGETATEDVARDRHSAGAGIGRHVVDAELTTVIVRDRVDVPHAERVGHLQDVAGADVGRMQHAIRSGLQIHSFHGTADVDVGRRGRGGCEADGRGLLVLAVFGLPVGLHVVGQLHRHRLASRVVFDAGRRTGQLVVARVQRFFAVAAGGDHEGQRQHGHQVAKHTGASLAVGGRLGSVQGTSSFKNRLKHRKIALFGR